MILNKGIIVVVSYTFKLIDTTSIRYFIRINRLCFKLKFIVGVCYVVLYRNLSHRSIQIAPKTGSITMRSGESSSDLCVFVCVEGGKYFFVTRPISRRRVPADCLAVWFFLISITYAKATPVP